jgi:hypothetical protein
MRYAEIITEASPGIIEKPRYRYHGTTPAKARSIVAQGIRPRGAKTNTFGKSVSFSDQPYGTHFYDRGALLVFEFLPHAKLISLQHFQRHGRGDADAVAGGTHLGEREIAVFNPAAIRFLGWYNKLTQQIDPQPPVYPKGFYHSWF